MLLLYYVSGGSRHALGTLSTSQPRALGIFEAPISTEMGM